MPEDTRPLCIDLFCGLGGWAEGFLAEGYRVVGFDNHRHVYPVVCKPCKGSGIVPAASVPESLEWDFCSECGGLGKVEQKYPGQLVIQDVLTLHGSQFRDAACIVASPPCQAYSYRAMPWKRAKALPPPSNELFDVCFRIQREACEAAGRYIPMVVENVKGAQPWVGSARWHYGSFYLWGDVPALMPFGKGARFTSRDCSVEALATGERDGIKQDKGRVPDEDAGTKQGGNWWHDPASMTRRHSSRSSARKQASAMIAKIPFPLSIWIAQCFKPDAATGERFRQASMPLMPEDPPVLL